MTELVSSVGEGAVNREADVRVVQQLLTASGFDTKGIDGKYGRNTRDAILAFQRTFLSAPDGRIDPGGRTIRRLQQKVAPSPADDGGGGPAGGAPITDWSGDSSRWSQEKKLASLEPTFRSKVVRVLDRLRQEGFRPKIVFGWRSVEVQARLKREGKTKVSFSFHNAQLPNGRPNAWAVDVIDQRWSWEEPDCHKFFRALGAAGKAEGLVWGGDWKSFPDWAHLQGRPNGDLAAAKRESGLARA